MESPMTTESEQSYHEDGVDLSLIRWMLSLSPLERLEALQSSVRSLMRLREVARHEP